MSICARIYVYIYSILYTYTIYRDKYLIHTNEIIHTEDIFYQTYSLLSFTTAKSLLWQRHGVQICLSFTYLPFIYQRMLFFDIKFELTLSTSSNTRRKFLRRTSANSVSVQFLCRSSWIRAGYFDTSSNP